MKREKERGKGKREREREGWEEERVEGEDGKTVKREERKV